MKPLVFGEFSGGIFRVAYPAALLLLLLVPVVFYLLRRRDKRGRTPLKFPTVGLVSAAVRGMNPMKWRRALDLLRVLALTLLILALSRPQFGRVERQTFTEGIDISLVLDVSLSMRASDFYPNRLEAAKEVLKEFVGDRQGDRLSLVIFGAEAVTMVPFTLDYGVVQSFIDRIRFNLVNGETTAVGMGLATALNKLRGSDAKSRVVILLTDGENNSGKIDPLKAAEAARASKVRVYTIGVGSEMQQTPFGMRMEAGIDEPTLRQIAEMTDGLYFRATDNEKLSDIYEQIDQLEKSKVESTQHDNFNELVSWLAFPALLLLGLEIILRSTRFVTVP